MAANADASWADRAAKAVLLIRVLVGWVFLAEGIQKFLFPDSLGGRTLCEDRHSLATGHGAVCRGG
jgi:hypothetical protein